MVIRVIQPDTKEPFLALALQTVSDGIARRRYHKTVIRTGDFVKDSANLSFKVTDKTIKHWQDTFSRMKANGVRVPIPNQHKNSEDPDANRGYVDDMFVDGDKLVMTCTLVGKDSLLAAARSDVSISVPPEFTDGEGNKYERPIMHVAMCTDPVIPGLGEFVPLAASLAHKENNGMNWTKIKESLGIKGEMTDDSAAGQIAEAFKALKAESAGNKTKLTASQDELEAEKAKNKDKGSEGDKGTDENTEPSATLVSLAADNRQMKLDALVSAGNITPAVRDKLAAKFIGEGDDRKPLILQLSNDSSTEFDSLVAALKENDPVKLKEHTKGQTMELSDSSNGSGSGNVMDNAVAKEVEKAKT